MPCSSFRLEWEYGTILTCHYLREHYLREPFLFERTQINLMISIRRLLLSIMVLSQIEYCTKLNVSILIGFIDVQACRKYWRTHTRFISHHLKDLDRAIRNISTRQVLKKLQGALIGIAKTVRSVKCYYSQVRSIILKQ